MAPSDIRKNEFEFGTKTFMLHLCKFQFWFVKEFSKNKTVNKKILRLIKTDIQLWCIQN